MKPLYLIVIFSLAACSAWTGSAPNESRFSTAAESWTGASLDEMIAVWGPPRRYLEDPEMEDAGIAIWRSTWGDAYRCNISAWCDPDRIVTRIDVTSHKCDENYEEHLDMLIRRR